MNNGFQPKKKGDGTPPAPPTSGINIPIPLVCDEILKSMKIELDEKTKKEFILTFYNMLFSAIDEFLIYGTGKREENVMNAKEVIEEFKKESVKLRGI